MRSYYTYGAIPDPVRTVRGFEDGGLSSAAEKPLYQKLYESGQISKEQYLDYVEKNKQAVQEAEQYKSALAQSPEMQKQVADNAKMLASLSFVDPRSLSGLSAFSADPNIATTAISKANTRPEGGSQGAMYEEGALENAKAAAQLDPTQGLFGAGYKALLEENPELAKAQIADLQARNLANVAAYEKDYDVMKPLSDLLKQDRFQEAFAFAEKNGVTNKLLDTNTLKNLREPFSPEEMQGFFEAMPKDIAGSKFEFNAGTGVARSLDPFGTGKAMQSGYPDPNAAFTRKATTEEKIFEGAIKTALAAAALYGGAQFVSGLGGAGGAGAGTAGTAGATGTAAGTLSGTTVGGALAGATPEALTEVMVTASKVGKLGQVIGALTATAGGTAALNSALNQMASSPVTASGEPLPSDLQEIVVQSGRGTGLANFAPALAAAPTAAEIASSLTPTTPALEPPPPETTPPEDLEEVTVKAQRPMDWSWLDPALAAAPTAAEIASNLTPTTPPLEEPLEEVTVKAKRPMDWSWLDPALAAAPTAAEIASTLTPTTPPLEPPPELEEVEVTAKKPPYPFTPPPPPVFPPPDLKPPPKPEDILKDYKPTEIKEPPSSPLTDLLKDPKNIARIIGALASAFSSKPSTPTTTTTGPSDTGLGGALPKYTYERTQLAPPIDYYTYGTRPEAKFFEGAFKLAEPTQPPSTEESPVISKAVGGYIHDNMTGGLIGYAHGGKAHTPEDYVEGPGSGREDLIPAMLSDGEYVIDAETLALLGDGSTKEGARRMDQFRANIRKHKGRALSRGRISPNAKSPDKYMGGGLT